MELTEIQYKKLLLCWQIMTLASFITGYALSEWLNNNNVGEKAQSIINEMKEEGIICPCNQYINYNQSNGYTGLEYPLFSKKT